MKIWIMMLVIGLLVIAGFVAAQVVQSEPIAENDENLQCSTCGNSCTQESNCGRESCGAVTGGSCNCRG